MKEIIDYLNRIGFETANSNFLFLKELIESKDFSDDYGMSKSEYDHVQFLIHTHII